VGKKKNKEKEKMISKFYFELIERELKKEFKQNIFKSILSATMLSSFSFAVYFNWKILVGNFITISIATFIGCTMADFFKAYHNIKKGKSE
jgi:hypothetical protein